MYLAVIGCQILSLHIKLTRFRCAGAIGVGTDKQGRRPVRASSTRLQLRPDVN